MTDSAKEIIRLLIIDRDYHKERLRKIETAISILDNTSSSQSTLSVQWSYQIKTIFDTGSILSQKELRTMLFDNGIQEVKTQSGKNSVYATVNRLLKAKYIQKSEGKYHKRLVNL